MILEKIYIIHQLVTLLFPIWASLSFAAFNIAMQLPGPASTGSMAENANNLYLNCF